MSNPVNGGNDLFEVDGNGIGNQTVANGVATQTFTAGGAGGPAQISVAYQGVDGQYAPSSGQATLTVTVPLQNTQTTVTLDPNPANVGDTVTVTATTTVIP